MTPVRPYGGPPAPPEPSSRARAVVVHVLVTGGIVLGSLASGALLGWAVWSLTRNM